jgi:protein-S-isoprenylcysteine O-methyltransferase
MSFGEFLRKGALIQAGHNFTQKIADANNKLDKHKLVTDQVYSLSRHPGYFGWFWWSVSTQILLCNPLSTMAFAYVSFKFFKDRIRYEEYFLCQYFPDYPEYRKRVPTRIPGIP